MRLRDLLKKFRLVLPVFGILLGSCAGSLNLPTMNRKNALSDGASYLSNGTVAMSLYVGNPSYSPYSDWNSLFTLTFGNGDSVTFMSASNDSFGYACPYLSPSSATLFMSHVLNSSDLVLENGYLLLGTPVNAGYTGNSDVRIAFDSLYTSYLYGQFSRIREEVYIPADDPYLLGRNVGYSEGYASGYDIGNSVGNSVGYSEGYSVGYSDGFDSATSVDCTVTVKVADNFDSSTFTGHFEVKASYTSYYLHDVLDANIGGPYSSSVSYLSPSSGSYFYLSYDMQDGTTPNDGYICASITDPLGNTYAITDQSLVDGDIYLPFWWPRLTINVWATATSSYPSGAGDGNRLYGVISPDELNNVLIAFDDEVYGEGYDAGFDVGFDSGYGSGYYDMSVIAGSEIAQTSNEAYNDGRASVGNEENAITNLLGSIVSVPISVLNGLMPLAIWNTPIISILVTLMVIALVLWLVRVLI